MPNKFYFVDLSQSTAKPFDGMKAGKFTAMDGRPVEFADADMGAFLAGTQAAIDATKAESGDVVGLPIDMRNHDHGDAAGWIVGAELMGDVIRLSAKWTQAGLDLIGAGLQRFFSPSVDMANKAIIGGSLTNWPATRAGGKTLLRPIELSQGVYSFALTDDEMGAVMDAFFALYPGGEGEPQYAPIDAKEDYLVVTDGTDLLKVTYTLTDGAYEFAPVESWVKVQVEYEEIEAEGEPAPEDAPAPVEVAPDEMSIPAESVAELTEAQIAALVDERVNVRLAELARIADRERDTRDFSERVCNGTKDSPIGLSVPPADLCAILLSLPEDGAEKVKSLLSHVVKIGVVNFAERGHGQIIENKPALDAQSARHLAAWVKSGKTMASFFDVNPEVGKASDYNLTEYQKG